MMHIQITCMALKIARYIGLICHLCRL
ncbi:hypothetical protein QUC31_010752 [Theobroma cacao]